MTRGTATVGNDDEPTSRARRLRAGLALLVGWSAPRFEQFDNQLETETLAGWWGGPEPDWERDFEWLTAGQRDELARLYRAGADELAGWVADWSGRVVVCGDPDYPSGFDQLDRPPAAIHVLGDAELLIRPGLGVVGSRDIGVSAASAARRILEPAVRRGMTVVSGGALGSDAVAHRAAVATGSATMVVLPSGVHNPSPKTNRSLFRDVVEGHGVLVSEYPPDQGVRRYHFRRRNSLIAAMSRGVAVLRAGSDSGTMLTVEAARQLDRPLGAMPGNPDDPLCHGCHEIIRRGGRLLASPDDLLEWWESLAPGELDEPTQQGDQQVDSGLARPDCEVLERARELRDSDGAFSIEALARETDRSPSELQTVLLEHELSGVVQRVAGSGRFRFCGPGP